MTYVNKTSFILEWRVNQLAQDMVQSPLSWKWYCHFELSRKANWIDHVLSRNCLLKYVIGRKIEGKGRLGIRRKQLLNDPKKTGRSCKLKEEGLDCPVWINRFGRGYGPVARHCVTMMWPLTLSRIVGLSSQEEFWSVKLFTWLDIYVGYWVRVVVGGLVVSVLATGPKVRGFNPGRGQWIFKGDKNP
jgi:hypothetical protein